MITCAVHTMRSVESRTFVEVPRIGEILEEKNGDSTVLLTVINVVHGNDPTNGAPNISLFCDNTVSDTEMEVDWDK